MSVKNITDSTDEERFFIPKFLKNVEEVRQYFFGVISNVADYKTDENDHYILNFKKEIKMNFNENKYKHIISELIHDFVKAWEESNSSYKTPHQIAEFLKEIKTKLMLEKEI